MGFDCQAEIVPYFLLPGVEKLIRMPKEEAKQDAAQNLQRISKPLPIPGKSSESQRADNTQQNIQIAESVDRVKAWSPQVNDSTAGMYHRGVL